MRARGMKKKGVAHAHNNYYCTRARTFSGSGYRVPGYGTGACAVLFEGGRRITTMVGNSGVVAVADHR